MDPNEKEWKSVQPIVRNLQVPFGSFNGAVPTAADGRVLAGGRAAPEPMPGNFDDVTRSSGRGSRLPTWGRSPRCPARGR